MAVYRNVEMSYVQQQKHSTETLDTKGNENSEKMRERNLPQREVFSSCHIGNPTAPNITISLG